MVGANTLYDTRELRAKLSDNQIKLDFVALFNLLTAKTGRHLFAQLEQYYHYTPDLKKRYPDVFSNGNNYKAFVAESIGNTFKHAKTYDKTKLNRSVAKALKATLEKELLNSFARLERNELGVNLVGYYHSATGMGESCRSMARILTAANVTSCLIPLANASIAPDFNFTALSDGELLKAYDPANKVNIIVANGDDYPCVRKLLPYSFFKNRKNIGYWVWEAENFPVKSADTEGLDEIWTPSEYSANAIRAAVKIPVRVVPHSLNLEEISLAKECRSAYNIPEQAIIFGFFFDALSIFERKNPEGLIRAFHLAFARDKDVVLLLKINNADKANAEVVELKRKCKHINAIFIDETLTRNETLNLMQSLDVYVSLHRSEGFGLTLAEAMAMSKPVVSTAYSGNLDFMSADNSFLVTATVGKTLKAYGPYPRGTIWGNPDLQEAARILRKLRSESERMHIGQSAYLTVTRNLNPENIGNTVIRLLS
jgi:glycosyltransferase involved in cell wall biosynthesis